MDQFGLAGNSVIRPSAKRKMPETTEETWKFHSWHAHHQAPQRSPETGNVRTLAQILQIEFFNIK